MVADVQMLITVLCMPWQIIQQPAVLKKVSLHVFNMKQVMHLYFSMDFLVHNVCLCAFMEDCFEFVLKIHVVVLNQ